MRWLLFVGCVCALSCREIEPFSSPGFFRGYQLEGSVTAQSGFPLQGAEIQLFYEYGNDFPPLDTAEIVIPDSVTVIEARIVTYEVNAVRNFSLPTTNRRLKRNLWDERDSTGVNVNNGLYLIRLFFNGAFSVQYTWLVDSHITAVTDVNGQFVISQTSLPIGAIVNLYDSSGAYSSTRDITADIVLRVFFGNVRRTTPPLTLAKDEITRIMIVL